MSVGAVRHSLRRNIWRQTRPRSPWPPMTELHDILLRTHKTRTKLYVLNRCRAALRDDPVSVTAQWHGTAAEHADLELALGRYCTCAFDPRSVS
jgi:hypothetical protein